MADNKSSIQIDQLYNRATGVPDYNTTAGFTITVTGTSASIGPLKGNATYLMTANTDCYVRFKATSATAVTTDHPFWAGNEWIVHTGSGTAYYVAAIQQTAAGKVWLSELIADRLG